MSLPSSEPPAGVEAQSPPNGSVNLDHVAHFVPDREACRLALRSLGFQPTPFSLQSHRLHSGAELTPAGTGNYCVMLRAGYLEFLLPLAETPVAAQLRSAIERYVGAHSIVFGSGDARLEEQRLRREGFAPLPAIGLQRTIGTVQGESIARFTVVRVPPRTMAEGRIQFCQHHSQDLVWQSRWLEHSNAATALRGALVCVENLAEAAERYERFTGIRAQIRPGIRRYQTQRGWFELYDRNTFEDCWRIEVPAMPWIAGCVLLSADLAATRRALAAGGLPIRELGSGRLLVEAPPAIGGMFVFEDA